MVSTPPFSNPETEPVPVVAKAAAPRKAPAKKAAASRAPATPRKRAAVASAKTPAPRKAPAKKAPTKATKSTPTKNAAQPDPAAETEPSSSTRRPARNLGPVEKAVTAELVQLGLERSALGAAAITAARTADEAREAGNASGTAAALREMRMVLPLAKTTVNPLSPKQGEESAAEDEDDDGKVVGPNRLEALRDKAAKRARS